MLNNFSLFQYVENTPWSNTPQMRFLSSMQIRETFAANLKKYRKAKGLSQEELAHQADLDRTYISSLERCVYAASIDVVGRIADVLEIKPSDLLRERKE